MGTGNLNWSEAMSKTQLSATEMMADMLDQIVAPLRPDRVRAATPSLSDEQIVTLSILGAVADGGQIDSYRPLGRALQSIGDADWARLGVEAREEDRWEGRDRGPAFDHLRDDHFYLCFKSLDILRKLLRP